MERVLISALRGMSGQTVRVCGWVERTHVTKTMVFVILRDETGIVQITQHRPSNSDLAQAMAEVPKESAVDIVGTITINPSVKVGGMEISPQSIEVVGRAETPLPLDTNAPLDHRLNWRYLDLRRPEMDLVFRLQTTIEHAMRQWWLTNGFREMHSPKLMGHASEGGAELFTLPYFGTTAALAQSPQFYKQMAMAAGWGKVFEIGPVFRANPSFTSRHDTEFTSVDVEVSWVDSHEDVMRVEEEWLIFVLAAVKAQHGSEILERFGIDVVVPSLPFPRVSMNEALRILREEKGHTPDRDGDLDPQGERLLAQWVMDHYGHEFVFVTDWPAHIRAFYHMRDAQGRSKSFDLIWKGLEITTGAQREHRLNLLTAQAIERGVDPASIQFYLDFFRYGMPPHGGFGFGLSRMLLNLTGLGNVREVTFLYRGPNRLTP